jgi:hypothetical protein
MLFLSNFEGEISLKSNTKMMKIYANETNLLYRYEEAEADCTSAIAIDKTLVKAFYRRAVARKRLGKTQLAISGIK